MKWLGWLVVFLLAFIAEAASAIWQVNEQRAVIRLQTRTAVKWSGLLACLGWVDYITADKMSLLAAIPGSILGTMWGTRLGIERKKAKMKIARAKRKPKPIDPELVRSVAEYIQSHQAEGTRANSPALPSTPPPPSQEV